MNEMEEADLAAQSTVDEAARAPLEPEESEGRQADQVGLAPGEIAAIEAEAESAKEVLTEAEQDQAAAKQKTDQRAVE